MQLDISRISRTFLLIACCLLFKCLLTDSREHYRRYNVGVKSGRNSEGGPEGDENLVSLDPPEFDRQTMDKDNITVEKGQTAFLHCKIKNQGTNIVSWVRYTPQLNIVSISDKIFSQDKRFVLSRKSGSSDWTLRVAAVQHADAGVYECQIGTDPKMGRNITLHVVDAQLQSDSEDTKPRTRTTGDEVARAVIKGERETQIGQSLNLTCYIASASSQTSPSNHIIKWLHNETIHLNYDPAFKSGHQIEIYQSPSGMFSRLTIRNTHNYHAGKYTCTARNAEPAVVVVQIHPSTQPVALRRDSGNSACHHSTFITAANIFSFLLIINSRIKS